MSRETLAPVSGEFRDRSREAVFRSERLQETIRHARLLFALSAALNTLFLLSDWRFYGQPHFLIALPSRLVVVAVSLLCWQLLRRAGSFAVAERIMVGWQIVTALGVAFLVSSRSDLALFVVMMLPSIYYLVVPTSFAWSLAAGVGCSILMLVGYLLPAPTHETALGLVLALVMLNTALYLVVARSNRLRRLEWSATQVARHTAEELRAAVEAAEQASLAKTRFLAAMSHEIRTPLHGITGLTSLILGRDDLDDAMRRQVELIEVSGSALLTVVNDVLDFSKIEAGAVELDPQPFWPKSLVTDCVAIISASAARKNLTIDVATGEALPNRLVGDEPRLRQVLLNLLNNAVKFTPSGRIDVSLKAQTLDDGRDRLRIAVADTGIGIPAGKLDLLFQRFSQVDSATNRQYGGTGLGLAISKQLVELMGGRIGVESEPGKGSTFWFEVELPRAEAPAPRPAVPVPSGDGRAGRILLAEDVELNQEIARALLENAGYEVDVVSDGTGAVRAVQERAYDLVLMDVQMPTMDGIMATRHIRSLAAPAGQVPIVAMTANVFTEQVRSFIEAGMNGHIGKPFKPDELTRVLARWVPPQPPGAPRSLS